MIRKLAQLIHHRVSLDIFFVILLFLSIYTTYYILPINYEFNILFEYKIFWLTIFFSLLSAISLFLRLKYKKYGLYFLIILYVICIVLELTLEVFNFANIKLNVDADQIVLDARRILAEKQRISFDNRNKKIEVVRDLRKNEKIEAFQILTPGRFIEGNGLKYGKNESSIFPLSGISNVTTVGCNETGFYDIYKSDKYGFNNPENLYNEHSLDYLILGDSVGTKTMGFALKKYNNQYKILNLGGPDGLLTQYAAYKEYATNVFPKNVIWLFQEGSLGLLKNELTSSLLLNYITNDNFSQNLVQNNDLRNRALKDYFQKNMLNTNYSGHEPYAEIIPRKLQNIVKLAHLRFYLDLQKPGSNDEELYFIDKILSKAHKEIQHKGSKLYFVYLPDYERYAQNKVKNNKSENKRKILSIVKSIGIEILDFQYLLDQTEDPLQVFPFRLKGHFTEQGYDLVAKMIMEET